MEDTKGLQTQLPVLHIHLQGVYSSVLKHNYWGSFSQIHLV